jgi:excisionase family DNA binding protein
MPNWSTKKQLAAFLGVSERTIDRLRRSGLLKAFKLGRLVRFRQEDVEEFLARQCDSQSA